jgi:hypothetical protein
VSPGTTALLTRTKMYFDVVGSKSVSAVRQAAASVQSETLLKA